MELLNEEIKSLSYKEIKFLVDKIDVFKEKRNEDLLKLIDKLSQDKRKNVNSLAQKLSKALEKINFEINRVKAMYDFDRKFNVRFLAGVDEVGRGPLAGPIVSCAVILDLNVLDDELILYLNDSKKISESKREELAEIIKKKALAYKICEKSNEEIDTKGIAYCNNQIFIEATTSINIKADLILSDGYLIKGSKIANEFVIKGDAKSASIAAASILAKVYRDNLMKEYAKEYPHYDFENNAGYGTSKHVDGIKKFGKCKIHRKSFLNNILNSL